jgi:hypothetical protein
VLVEEGLGVVGEEIALAPRELQTEVELVRGVVGSVRRDHEAA